MRDRVEQTEWCDRVGAAIVDGRILEDPGFWRPHVEKCETCRPRVEGLLTLRRLLERASLEAPISEVTPEQSERTLSGVFERFHRRRRTQRVAGCVVAALVVGGTAFWLTRPSSVVENGRDTDAVQYAQRLYRTVFADPSHPDYEALKRDEALRAEVVAALDDRSSGVRRTALVVLMESGVPVDPKRVEAALSGWHEDIETPIEVASVNDPSRAVSDAIEARRTATILAALRGSWVASAQRSTLVSPTTIEPFLRDRDPEIRRVALYALTDDPSYIPGEAVLRVLGRDTDAQVRTAAANCLLRRLGAEGAKLIVARLRAAPDAVVEVQVISALERFPELELPFARERLASAMTSPRARIWHARALLHAGERIAPEGIVGPAIAEGGAEALEDLANLATEADWASQRDALQAAWLRVAPGDPLRGFIALKLVRWDVKAGDASRAQLALDICAADRDPRLRGFVVVLSKSEVAAVHERAKALLLEWTDK